MSSVKENLQICVPTQTHTQSKEDFKDRSFYILLLYQLELITLLAKRAYRGL